MPIYPLFGKKVSNFHEKKCRQVSIEGHAQIFDQIVGVFDAHA